MKKLQNFATKGLSLNRPTTKADQLNSHTSKRSKLQKYYYSDISVVVVTVNKNLLKYYFLWFCPNMNSKMISTTCRRTGFQKELNPFEIQRLENTVCFIRYFLNKINLDDASPGISFKVRYCSMLLYQPPALAWERSICWKIFQIH